MPTQAITCPVCRIGNFTDRTFAAHQRDCQSAPALPHDPYRELSPGETTLRIKDAAENAVYWRRQKFLRTNPRGRADAGARAMLWESTLKALKAHLETFTTTPTNTEAHV